MLNINTPVDKRHQISNLKLKAHFEPSIVVCKTSETNFKKDEKL